MNAPFQLAGYEILEKLGEGGMSVVWKGRQLSLDRLVAIKVLSAEYLPDTEARERFQQEARAAARLNHPGIVQVFDAGVANGFPYIAMEYVEGRTLGDLLIGGNKLLESEALRMAEATGRALAYAWEKDCIVHCDIKPDNIMLATDGSVKLTDLGLARFIGLHRHSAHGTSIVGTPNYTAPEQAQGVPDLDCRADIYSLGATLYHLVTGTLPFAGSPGSSAMDRHVNEFLADPMDIEPTLSSNAAWLIEKMMVKNRAFRPMFWNAVLEDIAEVRSGHAPKPPLPEPGESTVLRSALREKPAVRIVAKKPKQPKIILNMPTRMAPTLAGDGVAVEVAADDAEEHLPPAPTPLGRALYQLIVLSAIAAGVYLIFFAGGVNPVATDVAETEEVGSVSKPLNAEIFAEPDEEEETGAASSEEPASEESEPEDGLVTFGSVAPLTPPDSGIEIEGFATVAGADAEVEEAIALSPEQQVVELSKLVLAPNWNTRPGVASPIWTELASLLRPFGRPSTGSSGETVELPLFGRINYRMFADEAAAILGITLGAKHPVETAGFPNNSFSYYLSRGSLMGSGFDTVALIVDGANRVAALQLIRESPAPLALDAASYKEDWKILDFVRGIGTSSPVRRVGHRMQSRDEVLLVESEIATINAAGEREAEARTALYVPQPLVNLLLLRLEGAH
ncbi:MAG: protein kinase [Kiritimatiellae bacterium]|nr:protein kinase [Kiritimatiellia bacterium]MCO5067397.1 serine/threonine protein kinase [Kiritimatiellia bacterium]